MNNIDSLSYGPIISDAENGNPYAMYELAMLYDCGAIKSSSDSGYIYWLKKFMESDIISEIIDEVDDEDGATQNLHRNFWEDYNYYPMIIEAGIALGLYYMNSSNIEEVNAARSAFYSAHIVSRFDFIEVESNDGITDIVSLLSQTNNRIEFLTNGVEQ